MGTLLEQKSNRDQQLATLQQQVFASKRAGRKHLAGLPFDAKYKLLVAMQKRSQAILAARGKTRRVWPED
jgi:hypothetical protein